MTVTIAGSDQDRRGFRLSTELLVSEARDEVFSFFSDARRLESMTPPWLHFSVRTPQPIEMRETTLIWYKLRLHGLPIRWQSRISCWEPPHQFVDEQLRGPYRYWHHRHTFELADEGTLIRDVVHYAVPLSFILHPLLVRRDLTSIFEFRRETMQRIFAPVDNSL